MHLSKFIYSDILLFIKKFYPLIYYLTLKLSNITFLILLIKLRTYDLITIFKNIN